jgi:hypothetical protein
MWRSEDFCEWEMFSSLNSKSRTWKTDYSDSKNLRKATIETRQHSFNFMGCLPKIHLKALDPDSNFFRIHLEWAWNWDSPGNVDPKNALKCCFILFIYHITCKKSPWHPSSPIVLGNLSHSQSINPCLTPCLFWCVLISHVAIAWYLILLTIQMLVYHSICFICISILQLKMGDAL